jgi:DNA-binding MurR/RpiR family transcriptional regulator
LASRLTLRIQERFSGLTPGEQKLGRLILEGQDDMLALSATELAEMASVSKATAARFFRSLGYSDFNEVRAQAREERDRTQPYHFARSFGSRGTLGPIAAHLEMELANLTRTFEDLNSTRLHTAAKLLAEASQVWVLGVGLEEGLARYARLLLTRLRHGVMLLNNDSGGWAESLAMTGPRDVLVLLTLDPRPRILKPILAYLHTTRVNIITVTDYTFIGRAERFSQVVLPCHVTSLGLGPSHTSMASVLRVLAVSYADYVGDAAIKRSEIIADIHEELDDVE